MEIIRIIYLLLIIIFIIILYLLLKLIIKLTGKIDNNSYNYGYKDNKKLSYEEIDFFRDIPFNGDIYYANILLILNEKENDRYNIIGAIILKWIMEGKIILEENDNDDNPLLKLEFLTNFSNNIEKRLYLLFYGASCDGILDKISLTDWCNSNSDTFYSVMYDIVNNEYLKLKKDNHIYVRKDENECNKNIVMDDIIYYDSVKLYGLKKYLEEFSKMDTKEVLEVKLWDQYLIFAYLFGISDTVLNKMEKVYPKSIKKYNIDYAKLKKINKFTTFSSIQPNNHDYSNGKNRPYANNKNSDFVGFNISNNDSHNSYIGHSSGGGGHGSFGGGGGGSR